MIKMDNLNWDKLGFFRFKKMKNNKYLLTNDVAECVFLDEKEFRSLLEGKIGEADPLYPVLRQQGLIKDRAAVEELINKYRQKNLFILQGPSLHIIVTTLRCDHKCLYCQASSRDESEQGYDLDIATAKKIVDTIFFSPSESLAIEFQGGEPLLNWPAVKFIVEYSREKNKLLKKNLELRLVSNFSLMDNEKMDFLVKNCVTLCTSLDGPQALHNKNRIWLKGNSYQQTIKWSKIAQRLYRKKVENIFRPGAIVTVSRHSLKYPKKIVDEYIKQGIETLFIRPLTPLGMARKLWEKIGYTPQEYLCFYRAVLNHTVDYALRHPASRFHENTTKIFLAKILTPSDPNYLELRSPCGAGIGQLLYNYDGRVYTCDEGRMVGEDVFCLGNIKNNAYKDIISHPTVRVLTMASCLENTSCDFCVYKPYCGVCPIYNWSESGNIFPPLPANDRCTINKGILDFLFEKIENKKTRSLFQKWANYTLPEVKK